MSVNSTRASTKRKNIELDNSYEATNKVNNSTEETVTVCNKKIKVENTTETSDNSGTLINKKKRGGTRSLNLYRQSSILHSDLKTIELCQELGIIQKSANCPNCKQKLHKLFPIQRKKGRLSYRFQCNRGSCKLSRNQVCIRENSFFKGINISLQKGLVIIYCFINEFDYFLAIHESSISSDVESQSVDENLTGQNIIQTSPETVSGFYIYCREVCLLVIEKHKVDYVGGRDKTVEIHTALFGKRKYSSGIFEEGQWVMTGVCRETQQVFLTEVTSADDLDTLIQAVEQHVLPGTTIIVTENLPLHKALTAKSKKSGRKNKGSWSIVKSQQQKGLQGRYRKQHYFLHLAEYIYRRIRPREGLFERFLTDCGEIFSKSLDSDSVTLNDTEELVNTVIKPDPVISDSAVDEHNTDFPDTRSLVGKSCAEFANEEDFPLNKDFSDTAMEKQGISLSNGDVIFEVDSTDVPEAVQEVLVMIEEEN